MKIPVFVINLLKRTERKLHIIGELDGREEFHVVLFRAIYHDIGAIGLWKSVRQIVSEAKNNNLDYFILCEDDHQFTKYYCPLQLFKKIEQVNAYKGDLLLGGISSFSDAIEIERDLFLVNNFTGLQFTVIFSRFYDKILNIDFNKSDNLDILLSHISERIFCINPFISIQKEFGHSDITARNGDPGIVSEYFKKSEKRFNVLSFLNDHFKKIGN